MGRGGRYSRGCGVPRTVYARIIILVSPQGRTQMHSPALRAKHARTPTSFSPLHEPV